MRDGQTGVFRGLGSDLQYGLRSLHQHPAIAAVALVTLSLGIGRILERNSVRNRHALRHRADAENVGAGNGVRTLCVIAKS